MRKTALTTIEGLYGLAGQPWRKFYAWMLNWDDRNNTISNILAAPRAVSGTGQTLHDVKRGDYHLEFLKRHGLAPEHRVLDFGCGYGRTAIPLLRYLAPANYIGVDLSSARVRMAKDYVDHEGLQSKKPTFFVSDDCDLKYLPERSIDVFFAQSVFTHMPPDDAKNVLKAAHRVLAVDGMAVIDYDTTQSDKVKRLYVKGFYYPEAVFEGLVGEAGFDFTVLDDWEDDLPENLRHHSIRSLKLRPRR